MVQAHLSLWAVGQHVSTSITVLFRLYFSDSYSHPFPHLSAQGHALFVFVLPVPNTVPYKRLETVLQNEWPNVSLILPS